jgi:hypothetical protein
LEAYCHVSSPLRRYADLVNQRKLLASLGFLGGDVGVERDVFGEERALAMALNARAKEIKRFERELWYSQHLCLEGPTVPERACVVSWKLTGDKEAKLKVYVPAWRRMVSLRVLCESVESTGLEIVSLVGWRRRVCQGDWLTLRGYLDARRADPEHRYVFEILESETD